ncbi:biosynthetic arginine decarboxylase [Novipirellula artificiosorum]|uniref:Biosynthetic arginine decarboxylase n=1 Tax=Novipirellula artificiosorum TaxID=2528016 RepID=A0A5C6DYY6_9BACT|nr:biosynthetic arginine decarboxylase [Novipirellula artificiosorum]TWU41860.1 Biosynthetic arginine decarboxylase [Novipirellula artificiosorum]
MSIAESKKWSASDSASLYEIDRWGDGYFSVSDSGRLVVTPGRDPEEQIDLKELVDGLTQRGLDLPILLRFNGILRDRLKRLSECFGEAIEEFGYNNTYRCVFPIKVNQQRDVVAQFVQHGRSYGFGVEAGSKPEMLAVVAMTDSQTPIICNGFKDDDFIHLAMRAQQIGRTVIPVVEKVSELDLILKHAQVIGVRPTIGMRVKLATRGSGRWQASGGYRSKFGLTVAEMLRQLQMLEDRGMADCFKLLHFHVGSQITHIRQLKAAILEAARIYVNLRRRGAGLEILDVGGGLGVDYDGTHSDNESSMNYSMQEYAKDVVYLVQTVCDEADVPHPELISESGRAVAAHHSVLIVNTLGVTHQGSVQDLPADVPDEYEQPVRDLWLTYQDLTEENMLESFHDSQTSLDLAMNLFSGGYLPLEQRVVAENLYFAICHRVREFAGAMEYVPDDVKHLNRLLSDIYFANFSLFQSIPDSWAIDQLFPVMPIHRLEEQPVRHAVIGDITCDSDGKIDRFVGGEGPQRTLLLHHWIANQPYQIGIFMVGAYQEILGDLHNLFGDTHAVHVDMKDGAVRIDSVVKGDTVNEVLGYVQYDNRELSRRWLEAIESAVQRGLIDNTQAGEMIRFYERSLESYTYLSENGNSVSQVKPVADLATEGITP